MEAEKNKHLPENTHQQDNDGTQDSTLPETPKETETKSEIIEAHDKEDEPNESNIQEPPDFEKASEEIDQFIATLSTATKDEESGLPDIPQIFQHFAFLVEANIANYDSIENPMKWSQLSEEESSSFLNALDRVSKLMISLRKFSSELKYVMPINRISGILHRAMCYLEDEFRLFLEDPKTLLSLDHGDEPNQEVDQSSPKESKSTGENSFPGYSNEVISNLNTLVNWMTKADYEAECYQIYVISRRMILEETLRKLGFEKLSLDEIQKMQWEPLEREIVSWNNTFKQFLSVYLPGELKLSESIFSGDKSIPDGLFSSLARITTIQLLNFAEAVAITKRSSEKLFKFLDIYETLRDAISAMDELFPEEMAKELKSEASLIRSKFGETMVSIFGELEISIKADTGKTTVPGGAVHPLTRYTLNYLKYACEYKDTLEQVFKEHQKIDQSYNNHQNQKVQNLSAFGLQINKVMDLLDANLEAKSKLYKDNSLSSIFMMNNGRYILQKIKGSPEINGLMGDTWSRKRSSDLRQYHKNYQRETWGRLLNCLTHEGLSVNGKVVKPVLKERFKSFNAMFDEIHKTQSAWVVSDDQLQSELRVSISAVVIPAYRSFLARFSQIFTPGRQTEKYIKFQPEDIETYIDELFDGNTTPTGRKRP